MITPDTVPAIGRAERNQREQTIHFLAGNIPYCRLGTGATGRAIRAEQERLRAAYVELPDGEALVNCRSCAKWLADRPALRTHHFPRLEPDLRWI